MALTYQLQSIRDALGGVCQLCGMKAGKLLCDHNHATGLIRGFVCHSCNVTRIPNAEQADAPTDTHAHAYLSNPPLAHLQLWYRGKSHTMETVLIRFPPEMLQELRAVSDQKGISVACAVRSILDTWLQSRTPTFVLASTARKSWR
jgi:hypothetical protein